MPECTAIVSLNSSFYRPYYSSNSFFMLGITLPAKIVSAKLGLDVSTCQIYEIHSEHLKNQLY